MGQLSERLARSIYPTTSTKTFWYGHALNEERHAEQCIKSVKEIMNPDFMVVGIDTRTTDRTEEICKDYGVHTFPLEWQHHFGWAKNRCVAECVKLGMRRGDIENCFGLDWELLYYDHDFFTDSHNFFGCVRVSEHGTDVWSDRALFSRFADEFKWQKPAHETKTGRAYLLTCKGILDSGTSANRKFPVIATAKHYGLEKKGGYDGSRFIRDSWYYTILVSLWDLSFRTLQPCEDGNDLLNLIRYAYDNPNLENGLDYWMNQMLERCLNGDVPKGLSIYREHYLENVEALEHNL